MAVVTTAIPLKRLKGKSVVTTDLTVKELSK